MRIRFPLACVVAGLAAVPVQAQTDTESPLVQTTCDNSAAQRWIFVPNRNGNHIVNQQSGLMDRLGVNR